MKHALPCVGTHIGHESIATFINAHFVCKFLSCCEKLCKYRSIFKCEVSHRSNVLAGNEQNMFGRLWIDIHKRNNILILIDDVTWYCTSCDLTKESVLHTNSS